MQTTFGKIAIGSEFQWQGKTYRKKDDSWALRIGAELQADDQDQTHRFYPEIEITAIQPTNRD